MFLSGRFLKGFITVCYLLMATNVAGVAQGCTCNDRMHGHDSAMMAAMMDMADVDCAGGAPKNTHIGIQNWDYYLPAPALALFSFPETRLYASYRTVRPSVAGRTPDKIPI